MSAPVGSPPGSVCGLSGRSVTDDALEAMGIARTAEQNAAVHDTVHTSHLTPVLSAQAVRLHGWDDKTMSLSDRESDHPPRLRSAQVVARPAATDFTAASDTGAGARERCVGATLRKPGCVGAMI